MSDTNTLSAELTWRGFVNQTTYKDLTALDGESITFYWGVDPSADSMTIGNLAAAMMVRHFIDHGHKAILLVGGATGMIGDPDGKAQERDLLTVEQIEHNKQAISEQYRRVFAGQDFEIVDNYDWFKGINYLEFLRDVGKHVPMRQMLGRDFVQSRLGEGGAGISYAEFSYSLIQGYDFYWLHREKAVSLQVCGADQWGNSITGVDLIRRLTGDEAHVYSVPLIVNNATGVKFGKSESGAVWLDAKRTPANEFYQFWVNVDDGGVESYLRIYTLLSQDEIAGVMNEFNANRAGRIAQKRLAWEVTRLIHGEDAAHAAEAYAANLRTTTAEEVIEVPSGTNIADTLAASGLAGSKSEARQLLADGGVYVNDQQVSHEVFEDADFHDGQLVLRKGKKLQNSVVVRLRA